MEKLLLFLLLLWLCLTAITIHQKKVLTYRISTLTNINKKYENDIIVLRALVQELGETNKKSSAELPEGTLEAVKFAMKMSHPDNKGNIKEFIKYSEVYDKLKSLINSN